MDTRKSKLGARVLSALDMGVRGFANSCFVFLEKISTPNA